MLVMIGTTMITLDQKQWGWGTSRLPAFWPATRGMACTSCGACGPVVRMPEPTLRHGEGVDGTHGSVTMPMASGGQERQWRAAAAPSKRRRRAGRWPSRDRSAAATSRAAPAAPEAAPPPSVGVRSGSWRPPVPPSRRSESPATCGRRWSCGRARTPADTAASPRRVDRPLNSTKGRICGRAASDLLGAPRTVVAHTLSVTPSCSTRLEALAAEDGT